MIIFVLLHTFFGLIPAERCITSITQNTSLTQTFFHPHWPQFSGPVYNKSQGVQGLLLLGYTFAAAVFEVYLDMGSRRFNDIRLKFQSSGLPGYLSQNEKNKHIVLTENCTSG